MISYNSFKFTDSISIESLNESCYESPLSNKHKPLYYPNHSNYNFHKREEEELDYAEIFHFDNECTNEFDTYHSPSATSNPPSSAAVPATTPSTLSLYASKYIPHTHLTFTLPPTLPSSPPIISPIITKYSSTIPDLYHHEDSPYPLSPTLYEAPTFVIPTRNQHSPYSATQTTNTLHYIFSYWTW